MTEQTVILVTADADNLVPLAAVIGTILLQNPRIISPHEVMGVLSSGDVDLAIVDLQKNKDTLPLIRVIKDHFLCVPLVALVPYGDVMMVEQVIAQGADDYITQPISLERLKVTLRNALRLRDLLVGEGHALHTTKANISTLTTMLNHAGKIKTLREIEDMVIAHAIESCAGCITQAARALGIGRSTLYRKMQERLDSQAQISRENQTTRPMMVASSSGDS